MELPLSISRSPPRITVLLASFPAINVLITILQPARYYQMKPSALPHKSSRSSLVSRKLLPWKGFLEICWKYSDQYLQYQAEGYPLVEGGVRCGGVTTLCWEGEGERAGRMGGFIVGRATGIGTLVRHQLRVYEAPHGALILCPDMEGWVDPAVIIQHLARHIWGGLKSCHKTCPASQFPPS